nr:hypothetical protein [Tanacetum cinerariifolium]
MPPISSLDMGGSSSQQHTHQPMSPISSFSAIDELADEHEICDEYLTDGYLTEQQKHQLRLDEKALRETLEEKANAEKEWEERMKKEQTENELFRSGETDGYGGGVTNATVVKHADDVGGGYDVGGWDEVEPRICCLGLGDYDVGERDA